VPVCDEAFGVPVENVLRLVRTIRRRNRGDIWEQEHEEYDLSGRLVAVYESWPCGGPSPAGREGGASARGGFVKYAPDGRLLRRSDTPPASADDAAGPVAFIIGDPHAR
jgi:hypothetical protein